MSEQTDGQPDVTKPIETWSKAEYEVLTEWTKARLGERQVQVVTTVTTPSTPLNPGVLGRQGWLAANKHQETMERVLDTALRYGLAVGRGAPPDVCERTADELHWAIIQERDQYQTNSYEWGYWERLRQRWLQRLMVGQALPTAATPPTPQGPIEWV
jgi:hypothetical protein